jgi:hypothetical protein
MAHLFKNGDGIAGLNRILAQIDQFLEQLIHVGKIKIAGEDEVLGHPVVLTHEGMDIQDAVLSESTVAEMAEVQFTQHLYLLLKPGDIIKAVRMTVFELLQVGTYFAENVLDGSISD